MSCDKEIVSSNTNPSLDEDDDDEEFEDALTDLGHLTPNDDDNDEQFTDPGLPVFPPLNRTNDSDPASLAGQEIPTLALPLLTSRVANADSESDSPTVENAADSHSDPLKNESGAHENELISSSNDGREPSSSEQSLPNETEFVTDAQEASGSRTDQVELPHHDNSRTTNSENASFPLDSTTDSRFEDAVPSSSGVDDFTCDLPSDELNDGTEEEEEEEGEGEAMRPPVFEVDEEEERVRRLESQWTEEEKEERKLEANALKSRGNQAFKLGQFDDAEDLYSQALAICPTCFPHDRSIIYSNRSACKLRKSEDEASLLDCTRALKLNPDYIKCLLRRAELYERTEKLDESLTDYKHVYELDRTIHVAAAAIMRLEQMIVERNEKMKEEMMGQLKNLGNLILKPFGLSTENFQLQQDPNSGGYSINFQR